MPRSGTRFESFGQQRDEQFLQEVDVVDGSIPIAEQLAVGAQLLNPQIDLIGKLCIELDRRAGIPHDLLVGFDAVGNRRRS